MGVISSTLRSFNPSETIPGTHNRKLGEAQKSAPGWNRTKLLQTRNPQSTHYTA
jgi:hypothetical protein